MASICPVCPTYLSGHSLHIGILRFGYMNLFYPLLVFKWFRIVFVILNAILMLVFLNNFVIVLVSGP
jgi:hypothetical protein